MALAGAGFDIGITWYGDPDGAGRTAAEGTRHRPALRGRRDDLTRLPEAGSVVDDGGAHLPPTSRLRGVVRDVQVGALPVVVEDGEDLDGTVVGADGVRDHGRELGRVAGLDEDGPVPQA